jgi:hypothetical protein
MMLGDKSVMSDEGLYHGQSYDIVMSCYLIKPPTVNCNAVTVSMQLNSHCRPRFLQRLR